MLIDTRPLQLCCSNGSQKCEWKNNEHRRNREKKKAKKKLQFENLILNFLRNIAFTILATFQIFCYNYLVNRQV